MALETLSNITQDEIEYARLCNQIKSELDWQSRETHAKREGRKEGEEIGMSIGLKEGIAQEKLIIAKNLLSEGSTPEFIQRITGLSLETIAEL